MTADVRPIDGSRAWVPPPELVARLESEVLEAIAHDPACLARVVEIVSPLDFSQWKHRILFAAMQRCEIVSIPMLCEELGRTGELDRVGGVAEVASLVDGSATSANVEVHARAVRRHSLERRARELHARAADGEDQVRAQLAQVEDDLADLEARRDLSLLLSSGAQLEALREEEEPFSPLPGLLDTEPSLHLSQGRPKSGKTRLAFWLALAWAEGIAPWEGGHRLPGSRALIVSAEQSVRRVERTLRQLSLRLPGSNMGRWTERVSIAARRRGKGSAGLRRMLCLDELGLSMLRTVLDPARNGDDPFGLVVLDSLSRLKPPDADENNADDMTAVCGGLQALAEELGIYVLLIHHRGHTSDAGRAGAIGASRGSSAIAAVAQVAWTLAHVPGEPRQRTLAVAGNEVLEKDWCFRVAAEKATAGYIDFWRPVDPVDDAVSRLDDLIGPGESLSTTRLAWRIAGQPIPPKDQRPPGEAMRLAAQLRERWSRKGDVEERAGKRGAKMIHRPELVEPEPEPPPPEEQPLEL